MTDEELIARLQGAADRIEALVKERNIAQHQARMRKRFIEEARDERDRAETRAERLEEALRWYASDEAWTIGEVEGPYGDYGKRARAALKGADYD